MLPCCRRPHADDMPCSEDISFQSMGLIYLVRHGRTAPQPANPRDPELGPDGQLQAHAVARALDARVQRPLPILTSPLRRCRETAAPLASLWKIEPIIEPRVAEVPSPIGTERAVWFQQTLASSWHEVARCGNALQPGYESLLAAWRRDVAEAILACSGDTVVFSHFVPINVLAGLALGQSRVTCLRLDHASVTVFETVAGDVRLIESGREQETTVV